MSDFDARMESLRSRFRSRAGNEAVRLEAALSPVDRAELLRVSHIIVGSAGMFGFAALGAQAALVEDAIDAGEGDNRLIELARALVMALKQLAQRV